MRIEYNTHLEGVNFNTYVASLSFFYSIEKRFDRSLRSIRKSFPTGVYEKSSLEKFISFYFYITWTIELLAPRITCMPWYAQKF